MPAVTAVVLDETQWEQLRAIIARLSCSEPTTVKPAVELPPAPPSNEEVEKLLRALRPCGSYAVALCRVRMSCLENGHGGILNTVSAMDRIAHALLTKHLPWPHHRRTCTCEACKRRRSQDKAVSDFARRLAIVHRGYGLETAVLSAIRGAADLANDCQPMMAVMCDLTKLYLEHLKLPEKRAQQMLRF